MTSTDDYWVGPTIGNGSFGQVVYGRYKEGGSIVQSSGKQNCRMVDNNNNDGRRSECDSTTATTTNSSSCSIGQDFSMGREVAIKVVDKITVKKYPYILKGLYHERKLIKELLQPKTTTTTTTSSSSTLKNDDTYNNDNGRRNDETIQPESSGDDDTTAATATTTLPPPVIQIWASFHDSQCLYVVMELATGGDLQHLIDQVFSNGTSNTATKQVKESKSHNDDDGDHNNNDYCTPTVQKWIEQSVPFYVDQLVHAVSFIHSRHVIHCDLKPGNILLDKTTGRLVLADFSSAIVDVRQNEGLIDSSSSSLFSSQDCNFLFPRGTADYSSPELLKSSSSSQNDFSNESNLRSGDNAKQSIPCTITEEVDYWSVGCIIYCMLFGTSPFHRETEALTLDAVMEYTMKVEQECRSNFDNKSNSNSRNLPTRFSHSTKKDVPLLRDVCGLLTVDPNQRRSYWSTLCQANNDNPTASTLQLPEGVVLPCPSWKDDLEGYELKDGSGGWVVFQL